VKGEAMNDPQTVRVTFTCAHCGATNELTAAHLHEATLVHCSRCSSAAAPIGQLRDQLPTSPAAAWIAA